MPVINYIGKNLKTYNVSRHSHNYWEIIYCTAGDGRITFDDNSQIQYTANQLVIIPPHIVHGNNSENGFKNIHFTVENWTPPFRNAQCLTDNASEDLYSLLNICYKYFNTEAYNKSNIILSFTELILNMIVSFAGNMHSSEHVEAIQNAIIEHFSDPDFVVEQAYRDIPLSNDYIRRQFIKEKGFSPLHFLNNTRIAFAQKLLLSKNINNYKIYEIAEMCGFSDQLYFSRVFKKTVGVSPKEYTEIKKLENYNSQNE